MLRGEEVPGRSLLPSVQQWLDWKLTGVLPRAGGTLDQDPLFMKDLRAIIGLEKKIQNIADQRQQNKNTIREHLNSIRG